MLHEWETISDSVSAFWAECVQQLPPDTPRTDWWPRSQVYRLYKMWCDAGGRKPVAAAEFYRRAIGLGAEVIKSNGQRIINAHAELEQELPTPRDGGAW
jgi:phage/plasmid-associated DNA primase